MRKNVTPRMAIMIQSVTDDGGGRGAAVPGLSPRSRREGKGREGVRGEGRDLVGLSPLTRPLVTPLARGEGIQDRSERGTLNRHRDLVHRPAFRACLDDFRTLALAMSGLAADNLKKALPTNAPGRTRWLASLDDLRTGGARRGKQSGGLASFRGDPRAEELNVGRVAGTDRLLGLDQQLFPGEGDSHAIHHSSLDPGFQGTGVVDPTGLFEEVDDDLVGDSDDGVFFNFVVRNHRDRVVREARHGPLEALHVLRGSVDEQIDVFRRAYEALKNYGKAADQDIADAFGIQRFAEFEEVFELRRA